MAKLAPKMAKLLAKMAKSASKMAKLLPKMAKFPTKKANAASKMASVVRRQVSSTNVRVASVRDGARLACRSRMHCVLKELLAHLCGIFETISRKQAVIRHAFLGRS